MPNNMKKINPQSNKGFTLVETLVALFILTLAVTALFALIANSFFSAQYAKNELAATYLAQEAVDYIRNDRDTTAFEQGDWKKFLNHYGWANSDLCFDDSANHTGCSIDVTKFNWTTQKADIVLDCDKDALFGASKCPQYYLDSSPSSPAYFSYTNNSTSTVVPMKRQITMTVAKPNGIDEDELIIKVIVEWQNGSIVKSQTLQTSLLKWQ